MDYKLYEEDGKVIAKGLKYFIPKDIFECGQCFRWQEEKDGSYTIVALGRVLNVKKEGQDLIFTNTNIEDFKNIWHDYFDLDRDYGHVIEELKTDETLKKATEFGKGIRILNQDEWEILISFILSANNRIPMIKRSIALLSQQFGELIESYNGVEYYSFPRAESLSGLSVEDLAECKTGFRAKYIVAAADMVAKKEIDIYELGQLETAKARKELMKFAGVGPKVSDCIMLFSMGKEDAFPIDVWVKRVMEHFYLDEGTKLKDIQKFASHKFGKFAGFAQQYLFYYARELEIGK